MVESQMHFSSEQRAAVYYTFSQYLDLEKLASRVAKMHVQDSDRHDEVLRLSIESRRLAWSVGGIAHAGNFSLARQWAERRMDPEGWEKKVMTVLPNTRQENVMNLEEEHGPLKTGRSSRADRNPPEREWEKWQPWEEEEIVVTKKPGRKSLSHSRAVVPIDPETGLPEGFVERIEELEKKLRNPPPQKEIIKYLQAQGWGKDSTRAI